MSDLGRVISEKIYSWLLRLYPEHFRRAFGEEALQLFRDRVRDETGAFRKLRLWLDLAADLALSLPEEHTRAREPRMLETAPCFQVLANETPRRAALLSGALVALFTLGALPFLVSHSGGYENSSGLALEMPKPAGMPSPRPAPEGPSRAERVNTQQVVEEIADTLRKNYIDQEAAERMAAALFEHQQAGDYRMLRDTAAFADLLTAHLQEISHDPHLMVEAVPAPSRNAAGPPPEVLARFRREMQLTNCTFETVRMLPDGIGYLKLNAFPPPADCGGVAAASMAKLNGARAVIFDLRYNQGGSPEMVALLESYLFARRTRLDDIYNRAENSRREIWTAPVPGNRLADKPAYVLVSRGTVSAAEAFAYDLQMLKRATIVGRTTAGAAHLTRACGIGEFFTILVPVAKPVNAISKTDWEGTGVRPDVRSSADDALATAQRLAGRVTPK